MFAPERAHTGPNLHLHICIIQERLLFNFYATCKCIIILAGAEPPGDGERARRVSIHPTAKRDAKSGKRGKNRAEAAWKALLTLDLGRFLLFAPGDSSPSFPPGSSRPFLPDSPIPTLSAIPAIASQSRVIFQRPGEFNPFIPCICC